MIRKRKREALLGGALAGASTPGERERLARMHERAPQAREELDRLQAFLSELPADAPTLPADLLPGVRARLNETGPATARDWRLAGAAGLCMAAALVVLAPMVLPDRREPGADSVAETTTAPPPATAQRLSMANALLYEGRHAEAYDVLTEALARFPGQPFAPAAQQQLADLDFAEFQRYERAYEAYTRLRSEYPEQFASDPENAQRLDLLDEARRVRFASLNEFDAARTRRTGRLEALERVLARYASTHELAPRVAEEMADVLIADGAVDAQDGPLRVRALELARDRCTDPLALARLDLEIGKAYLRDAGDPRAARALGERVLAAGDPGLTELARGFLSSFEGAAEAGP